MHRLIFSLQITLLPKNIRKPEVETHNQTIVARVSFYEKSRADNRKRRGIEPKYRNEMIPRKTKTTGS